MEIIIGKTAGFCFGVENAVNKTNELLNENKNIFCLGELVHNKQVTSELEKKGLNIIENIEQAKKKVIIRAHGENKDIYDKAKNMKLELIDLTCPKVLKIHKVAEEYAKKGYYIFLIGNSSHPETIGTISYCGEKSYIIEDEKDIKIALQNLYNSQIQKVVVLSQTTFSIEKFNKFISIIEENIKNKNIKLEIKKTICEATKLRQEETKEISSKVEMMIIVGGKNSSNTNKLYEIAKKKCKNSVLVENEKELNLDEIKKYEKIGIMAGASTPKKSIEAIVEILKGLC